MNATKLVRISALALILFLTARLAAAPQRPVDAGEVVPGERQRDLGARAAAGNGRSRRRMSTPASPTSSPARRPCAS